MAAEHPPLHVVRPVPLPERVSRYRVVIGLSVAACLLAALVVTLVTRHPDAPSSGPSHRTVAVPIFVPEGFAFKEAGSGASIGLWGFNGSFEGSLVEYVKGGTAGLVVASAADTGPRPAAGQHTVTLLSGARASVTSDTSDTWIAWSQPDGPIVSVRGWGLTEADLIDIANNLWYVTPAMFERLTAHGGFMSPADSNRLRDGWRAAGTQHSAIGVRGSLQTGLSIALDSNWGLDSVTGDCRATNWSDGTPGLVLLGPGTTSEFALTMSDGSVVRVPADPHPGLPTLAITTVRATGGTLECLDGGS
ncbi:MAG: hypothetical protein Q7V57_10200 [Actinomycetota bacterium]|nr:hypothetical protein [Actinomycetota bacterium]